ncbi:carboxylate-amine ligase [Haloactinospora alba]|uniref:Putative glutamate--cysteine ligase 2 n=1 Tax=Haloactinospora alba TaxID=405555 RepID=A0A543NI78_9ACTN|nr:glutamate--cysteine ligase [Haloactinospora alba]TQN31546.1 carboxylate-amine ligase [Haloactinospora alba]
MNDPTRAPHQPRQSEHPGGSASLAPFEPTIGVEEEFFLVDAGTRRASARAQDILESGRGDPGNGGKLCAEITRFQVEAVSPVCRTGAELYDCLAHSRRKLAGAADDRGLAVTATGTAVLGEVGAPPITDGTRYRAIAEQFGALRDAHAVCGCHIHVGITDRETALGVVNQLRGWLPCLLALNANSPFIGGRDTGHASWRTVTWARLPSAGPPPWLSSMAEYEQAVSEMLASGAILDRGMVYWDVRLSAHVPTVEMRIGDAAATAEEAVLTALLVRGLAAVALDRIAMGEPPPIPGDRMLRLAIWRAAYDGLEGYTLDPVSGELATARNMVWRLLDVAAHGLSAPDQDLAQRLLARVLAAGSGAYRQRAAYARRGRISDVVDAIARQTRYGLVAVEEHG